jgi:hypothetical protein
VAAWPLWGFQLIAGAHASQGMEEVWITGGISNFGVRISEYKP